MQNEKGFTLVELMVVVVILGILVAIAIPVYNNVTKNAQEKACLANMRTIEGAAETWRAAQDPMVYPGSVKTLFDAGYLKSEPICPLGTESYDIDDDGNVTCPNVGVEGGDGHILRESSSGTGTGGEGEGGTP